MVKSNSVDDVEASQNPLPHVFMGKSMDDVATYSIHSNPKHEKI
jgi:hypothetical protein